MSLSIVVTGGSRSGKSVYAEERAKMLAEDKQLGLVYIATAEAFDAEMQARIEEHQTRRGDEWVNLHAPLNLAEAVQNSDGQGVCLVDCLTIWLNNLMFAEKDIQTETDALIAVVKQRSDPIIFVTNEVGSGIIPENALARRFRDEAGRLNQKFAAQVDEVYVSISGIAMRLKPQPQFN